MNAKLCSSIIFERNEIKITGLVTVIGEDFSYDRTVVNHKKINKVKDNRTYFQTSKKSLPSNHFIGLHIKTCKILILR